MAIRQFKIKNPRKWRSLSLILGSSFVLMVHFQNCAPAPMGEASLAADGTQQVGVIDDVKAGSTVSFAQKAVEIHSQVQAVQLEGVCPEGQQDAVLGWNIRESGSRVDFANGYARCENSKFIVELAPTQELACDHEYTVSARLGFGQGGEVKLSRRCEPSAVAAAPALKAQMAPVQEASCVIEKAERSESGCSAVCYDHEGVVVAKRELDSNQCSN